MLIRNPWPLVGVVVLSVSGGGLAADLPANLLPEQRSACHDQAMQDVIDTTMRGLSGKPASILALSGGGQFGAYGAAFLRGWRDATAGPRRPDPFELVTGTSTGSLIATFSFLGTKEDDDTILNEYLAINSDSDVFSNRLFLKLLWKDSLTTRNQFRRRLERVITKEVVRRVGQEARTGRRLLVGATDIETGCFHYFDLTELSRRAADDGVTPAEVERVRQDYVDRLMASTALPVQFPPVEIKEAHKQRTSVYVDGGVRRNLFIEPLMTAAAVNSVDLSVYVIFNGARGVDVADR
jgi:predicted acylesterase/phospholipase RssA